MTQRSVNLHQVSTVASWVTIGAGLTIVAGWQFRIPFLKGQAFGTFVAPNSALCFLCCATSVLLQLKSQKHLQVLGTFLGGVVLIFAAAVGVEYLFSVDLGIDQLFMSHRLSDWDLPLRGRFAVNSAFGFSCAGISLLTLRHRSGIWSEITAALVLLVSYLSAVAYLFGASVLYDHVMSVHTAVLFGVLAVALLTGTANPIMMSTLTSRFAGAVASRNMILWVMFLVPVFCGLELWAEQAHFVSIRLGTALSVIASVTTFTFLAIRSAAVLNETDRKRQESESALLESMKLAAAGRMAASIAHEVNNPLESITNLVFLLKGDNVTAAEKKSYLEMVETELTRVAAIARRTLGFYRDDGKESVIELGPLVDAVLDIYKTKLHESIVVCREYCESARIQGRTGEIQQVLTNLIANAIDALQTGGGRLTIATRCSDDSVMLVVRDNGPGIPSDNLKRIFEPFFTTKKNTGTGLGLWVSRELVLKNHGTILVQSSTDGVDHGTSFEISFPASQSIERTVSIARSSP